MTPSEMKDKSSVQAHISMMQGMINRMAGNSANCKVWCITILAAIMGLFYDNKFPHLDYCYYIIMLFYALDCFYLGLERTFVKEQSKYVDKINKGLFAEVENQTFKPYELPYNDDRRSTVEKEIAHLAKQLWDTIKATVSFSTTPFYAFALYAIYHLMNK